MSELPEVIEQLAIKYGVNVQRCDERDKNCGFSAGKNIWLSEFDNVDLELISFFHELGHTLSNERVLKRGCQMSMLSGEGLAWEIGLGIAYEHGYEWDYYSDTMKWARRQLRSYIDGEYDDTVER